MLEGLLLFFILMLPIILNSSLRALFLLALLGGRAVLVFGDDRRLYVKRLRGDGPLFECDKYEMYEGDATCFWRLGKGEVAATTNFYARLLNQADMEFLESTAHLNEAEFSKLANEIAVKVKRGEGKGIRFSENDAEQGIVVNALIPFHRLRLVLPLKGVAIDPRSARASYDFVRARMARERSKEMVQSVLTLAFAAFMILVGVAMVMAMLPSGGGGQAAQAAQAVGQAITQGVKP